MDRLLYEYLLEGVNLVNPRFMLGVFLLYSGEGGKRAV